MLQAPDLVSKIRNKMIKHKLTNGHSAEGGGLWGSGSSGHMKPSRERGQGEALKTDQRQERSTTGELDMMNGTHL